MPENPPLASAETTEIRDEKAFLAFHDLTPDGFMMFRPVRSEAGVIDDFEWTFVNKAAGQIVGRPTQDLLGKHLLVEMPGNRDEGLFDAYVKVVETGETWQQEFHYDHGGISAWFRTTAAALAAFLLVPDVQAQTPEDTEFALAATQELVLAHVLTGDAQVDDIAEAGLRGLAQTLFFRTSVEPSPPTGVDLELDELSFFPILYWPITPDQPRPSDAAP